MKPKKKAAKWVIQSPEGFVVSLSPNVSEKEAWRRYLGDLSQKPGYVRLGWKAVKI